MRTSIRLAAATLGLLAPLALVAPAAQAGGGASVGLVFFSPTATASGGTVTFDGGYFCSESAAPTADITVEARSASGTLLASWVREDVVCDDHDHDLDLTADLGIPAGPVTLTSTIGATDPTSGQYVFDVWTDRILVTPAR